jgi:hypothetical protein
MHSWMWPNAELVRFAKLRHCMVLMGARMLVIGVKTHTHSFATAR